MKITALNQTYTKKTLIHTFRKDVEEEIAVSEYSLALRLLLINNKIAALEIFENLLKTQLIHNLKQVIKDDSFQILKTLKYSCLKNISSLHNLNKNYHTALYNSLEAIHLDDTDVKMWYKIGDLSTKISLTELACIAYKQGLKKNYYFWPCLDKLISSLFAIPDYINCLFYISIALERDPLYMKGLVLINHIFKNIPSIYTSNQLYKELKVNLKLHSNSYELLNINNDMNTRILNNGYIEKLKLENTNKTLIILPLKNVVLKYSWLVLGQNLIQMYKYFDDNNLNFTNLVEIVTSDLFVETDFGLITDEQNIIIAEPKNNTLSIITKNTEKTNSNSSINLSDNENNESCECHSDNINIKSQLGSELDNNKKVKKRRRSSLSFLKQWAWSNDNVQRSSRVRSSGRKDRRKNYKLLEENLKQLFPPTLLLGNMKLITEKKTISDNAIKFNSNVLVSKIKQEEKSNCKLKDFGSNISAGSFETYFETIHEFTDVRNFIEKHSKKSSLIMIILEFLAFLCEKWNIEWPTNLTEVYIQLYLCLKNHIMYFPQIFHNALNNKFNSEVKIILLFWELYIDQILNAQPSMLLPHVQIEISPEDLGFLIYYSGIDKSSNLEINSYLFRMSWLRANIHLHKEETELSLKLLEELLVLIKKCKDETQIKLSNCKQNCIINEKSVKEVLNFIRRKKSFNSIKCLYELKKFKELSSVLMEAFKISNRIVQFTPSNETSFTHIEHMMILVDSLWQIEQYEECFKYAEICLTDSWQIYLNFLQTDPKKDEKKIIIQSILYFLDKLQHCIAEVGIFILKYLAQSRLSHLLQNLVQIVCHQLDMLDNDCNIIIESISPWIILHYIFLYEEDKQRAITHSVFKCKSYSSILSESDDDEENIPSSVKILVKAHEFLGHYGLCCMNHGELLKFTMNLIVPKLNCPLYFSLKKKFRAFLEQSIFCLYGYPLKLNSNLKSKPKFLDEHVKNHNELTWEAAQLIYEVYKPLNLPSFESKRVDSINTDTLLLFKNIINFIPKDSNPSFYVDEMNLFLVGSSEKVPIVKKPLPFQISYIYYLIADYYFKATTYQSWDSSIKYYTMDLCLHPDEFNSWVGLAMSTSTLMETWLNNFEPNITEEKYLHKAKIAQKSYQRAVDLEPLHLTVWTEYGNFLYTVHSFCSRLLKQESDSLSIERFKILENKKDKMLDKAKSCFSSAYNIYCSSYLLEEIQDERWLYQYMLAKVAEKKNEKPSTYLKHYLKAGMLLSENNAQYPKKINHKNPPHLSVEALEVYYRINTSILKYLEQNEDKIFKKSVISELENILVKCLKNPFTIQDFTFFNPLKLHMERNKLEKSDQQLREDPILLTDEITKKVQSKVYFEKLEFLKKESTCEMTYSKSIHPIKLELNESIEKSQKESVSEINEKFISNDESPLEKNQVVNDDDLLRLSSCSRIKCRKEKIKLLGKLNKETPQKNVAQTNKIDFDSKLFTPVQNPCGDSTKSFSYFLDNSVAENNETENRKNNLQKKIMSTSEEKKKLTEYCLAGLEQCVIRFPEHYKSIYRLAYFFCHSKVFKDIQKSHQLLLGVFQCQFHQNHTIQGLFSDRKSSNFFNGIWRIPVNEIDRPGSFAYHMSRCTMLLLEVLNETGDSKMLTEVCVQLQKVPDSDKKYLKDTEREQLSLQALTLCLQCLRNKITKFDGTESSVNNCYDQVDQLTQVLLEIYHTYKSIKNISQFETSHLPKFKKLLETAFLLYSATPSTTENIFEIAKDFCRQILRSRKNADFSRTHSSNQDLISDENEYKSVQIYDSLNSSMNKKHQEEVLRKKSPLSMSNRPKFFDQHTIKNLKKNYLCDSNLIFDISQKRVDLNTLNETQSSSTNTTANLTSNLSNLDYIPQKIYDCFQDNLNTDLKKKNSHSICVQGTLKTSVPDDHGGNVSNKKYDSLVSPVTQNIFNNQQKISEKLLHNSLESKNFLNSDIVQFAATSRFSLSEPLFRDQTPLKSVDKDKINSSNTLLLPTKNINVNQSDFLHRSTPSKSMKIFSTSHMQSVISSQESLVKKRCRYTTDLIEYPGRKKKKKSSNTLIGNISHHQSNSFNSVLSANYNYSKEEKLDMTPKKIEKSKICGSNNSSSVLSQVQQYPHLEILPQTVGIKNHQFTNNHKQEVLLSVTPNLKKFHDNILVQEIPQYRLHTTTVNASPAVAENNSVEVITLDD